MLYGAWNDNVQIDFSFENGPTDDIFSSADLIIDETIDSTDLDYANETRAVRADFDDFEKVLVACINTGSSSI